CREIASVLLAIEPLLLEDQNWDPLPEQGDPRVMGFAYDAKYLHKLSDSLRNSRGLAGLSATPRVLACHLGAKSAVCNGYTVHRRRSPSPRPTAPVKLRVWGFRSKPLAFSFRRVVGDLRIEPEAAVAAIGRQIEALTASTNSDIDAAFASQF